MVFFPTGETARQTVNMLKTEVAKHLGEMFAGMPVIAINQQLAVFIRFLQQAVPQLFVHVHGVIDVADAIIF